MLPNFYLFCMPTWQTQFCKVSFVHLLVIDKIIRILTMEQDVTKLMVGGRGAWTWHKSGGKIWGKVQPSSPNKRKNLGSSVTTRRKSNLEYLSPHLYFWRQNSGAPTRISEVNFGAKPPDLLIWKYPRGVVTHMFSFILFRKRNKMKVVK